MCLGPSFSWVPWAASVAAKGGHGVPPKSRGGQWVLVPWGLPDQRRETVGTPGPPSRPSPPKPGTSPLGRQRLTRGEALGWFQVPNHSLTPQCQALFIWAPSPDRSVTPCPRRQVYTTYSLSVVSPGALHTWKVINGESWVVGSQWGVSAQPPPTALSLLQPRRAYRELFKSSFSPLPPWRPWV